jgi:hypothetical protein
VAPAGISEILPVLDKAKAAGIPVLIVDTDVNWPAKLSYVGADNRVGGRIAGEYIVKLLGGKGKVAVIRGILGIATHEERLVPRQYGPAPRVPRFLESGWHSCFATGPKNRQTPGAAAARRPFQTDRPPRQGPYPLGVFTLRANHCKLMEWNPQPSR